MKRCQKCGIDKPESDFQTERRNRSGLSGTCRKCATEYKTSRQREQDAKSDIPRWKIYYEKNKAAAIARAKEWAEKNPDRNRELKREAWRRGYYKKTRPGRPAPPPKWPCQHCGKPMHTPPSAFKKGGGKHCSKACYHSAIKRLPNRNCARCGDPFWAAKHQLRKGQGNYCSLKCARVLDIAKRKATQKRSAAARRARKAGATVEPINFKRIEVRDRMRCHICRRKVTDRRDLNFDHVIPLSKGGLHVESNIAVSHKRCNFRKHDKVLTLF